MNDIYDSFNRGEKTVGVFLDLAKAYDTIDREKLCRKVEYYGVTGLTLQWFRSYLSMRRQAVRYKGARTDKAGLPAPPEWETQARGCAQKKRESRNQADKTNANNNYLLLVSMYKYFLNDKSPLIF